MQQRLASMVVLCVLLSSTRVLAESRPSMLADYVGDARSSAIELELGWYTDSEGSGSLHALAPVLSARVSATDHLDLELDWPFGFVSVSGDGNDEFRTGNPLVAGYYVQRQHDGYLRAGFGIAVPIASVDDTSDLLPLATGVAMRGLWDSWLYLPETLGLVLPFQIEKRMNALVLGGDTALGVLIPTSDRSDESDVAIQLAGLIGGKSGPVTAGARLQVVWVPTADGDNAQVALVPFVQGDFSGGFVYLRFLLNLDEPFGVFGDGADVWALSIGGGGRF
ncbi:MAG TPA: hypothetical protein VJV78_07390 [Polyangiales bacterium]|nr:hypothetical protein [Polyangiales bacterium]